MAFFVSAVLMQRLYKSFTISLTVVISALHILHIRISQQKQEEEAGKNNTTIFPTKVPLT